MPKRSWNDILEIQRRFDEDHGWSVPPDDHLGIVTSLRSDVIGLVGELGEVANILKRLQLDLNAGARPVDLLECNHPALAEELVDCAIYLMRMASTLNLDLESAYLEKLEFNRRRFGKYENPEGR